jgi:hypothetical protein
VKAFILRHRKIFSLLDTAGEFRLNLISKAILKKEEIGYLSQKKAGKSFETISTNALCKTGNMGRKI